MGSSDYYRLVTIIFSIITIIYMLLVMKRSKKYRWLVFIPFTLIANVFIKSVSVLFLLPLTPKQITFYNDWNFVIGIQTIIMIFLMTLYISKKGNYERII